MSATHLSAATEQLIEQRDQARVYVAQLEAELEQVRGRAQVAETELEAANTEVELNRKRLSRVATIQWRVHVEDGKRYVALNDLVAALDGES